MEYENALAQKDTMKTPLLLIFQILSISSLFGQISIGPSRELTNYVAQPTETTAVDLDLDGDLDVITHEKSFGWVTWYLNDGLGNFSKGGEWFPAINTSLEQWETLGFVDFDGDGLLDILGLLERDENSNQSICLVRGLGGATFEEGFTTVLVREPDLDDRSDKLIPLDVPLQDFDGDGRKDIVFAHYIVFLGEGSLNLTQTNVNLSYVTGWGNNHPFVDWDGDGMPDLVGASTTSGLIIRLNQGRGQFSQQQNMGLPSLGDRISFEIDPIKRTDGGGPLEFCLSYDVDNVDYLSIVTRADDGSVAVSATSKERDLLPLNIARSRTYGVRGERFIFTITPRLLEAKVDSYQLVWNGVKLSAEALVKAIPFNTFGVSELINADIDGDGNNDLVVTINGPDRVNGGATDEVFWLEDSVSGPYESIRNSIVEPSYQQSLQLASDINFDGLPDLITLQEGRLSTNNTGSLILWKNIGSGESFSRSILPGENTIISVLKTFQLDGSLAQLGGEFSDIDWLPGGLGMLVFRKIISDSVNYEIIPTISYLFQDSSGDFGLIDYLEIEDAELKSLKFEDFNGDDVEDLVYIQNLSSPTDAAPRFSIQLRFWSSQSRAFEAPVQVLENATLFGRPTDFDQDGDLDLHVHIMDATVSSGEYWIENESGVFTKLREFGGGISPSSQLDTPTTRLDLDGDGDLDQISAMHTSRINGWNRIGWLENRGSAEHADAEMTLLTPFSKTRWASRDSFLLSDLDGDGNKDLVVGSANSRLEWFKITQTAQRPSFSFWAASNDLSGHSASPLADWDGDTLTNWEEFVFGSDPDKVDPNHQGRPKIRVDESGPILTFSRRRDAGNEGVEFQYFRSLDLDTWSSWIPDGATLIPIDESYDRVSVPLNLPRAFFRVQPLPPPEE